MKRIIDIHTHLASEATTIRAVGTHPWLADRGLVLNEEEISLADAIGEIGLDRACSVNWEDQIRVFNAQLEWAGKYQKPVVLHCVKAFEEVMQTINGRRLPAVIFHGFIGSKEQAVRALKAGYYLSFGRRTLTSRKTIDALRLTPLNRLFVESDEDPTPIAQIYAEIARLREVSIDTLIEHTTLNYERIFRKE